MLEPFIWMFKAENFGKRYLQLLIAIVIFTLIAILTNLIGASLPKESGAANTFLIISIASPILLIFLIQGYFWELTAGIISRDIDIMASNIYSGKIKSVFKIKIPDFNPFSFIWRGFASIIASILMFIPFILLVMSTQYTQVFFLPYENAEFYHKIYAICYNVIYFLFFALIPALLWNYAKENSIVAVWNLRKAIYLLETYPLKYIWNTFLFIIFYLFNYLILFVIQKYVFNLSLLKITNISLISFGVFFFLFISYLIYLYSLHVYAYLLGTIAPTSEG